MATIDITIRTPLCVVSIVFARWSSTCPAARLPALQCRGVLFRSPDFAPMLTNGVWPHDPKERCHIIYPDQALSSSSRYAPYPNFTAGGTFHQAVNPSDLFDVLFVAHAAGILDPGLLDSLRKGSDSGPSRAPGSLFSDLHRPWLFPLLAALSLATFSLVLSIVVQESAKSLYLLQGLARFHPIGVVH